MPYMSPSGSEDVAPPQYTAVNGWNILSPPNTVPPVVARAVSRDYLPFLADAKWRDDSRKGDLDQFRILREDPRSLSAVLESALEAAVSPKTSSQPVWNKTETLWSQDGSKTAKLVQPIAPSPPPNHTDSRLMQSPSLVNMQPSINRTPPVREQKQYSVPTAPGVAQFPFDCESEVHIPLPELTSPLEMHLPTQSSNAVHARNIHLPTPSLQRRAMNRNMPRPISDVALDSHHNAVATLRDDHVPYFPIFLEDEGDNVSTEGITDDNDAEMTEEGLPADEELEQFVFFCLMTSRDV